MITFNPSTTNDASVLATTDSPAAAVSVAVGARKAAVDANDLSIAEVMYELRIGKTRAYELCATGVLAHRREGRGIRVPREAIQEYREATLRPRITTPTASIRR